MLFDFGYDVIDEVLEELKKSEKYIRIAIFQLHEQRVFEVLEEKLKSGVEVDIFTLPYDSVNEDIQEQVRRRFTNIDKLGAKIYFSNWNIGDPSRTTTAVNRWYSFHGKFIVTDKVAIALSANFTEENEIDAIIIYSAEEFISLFNSKFDELVSFFSNNQIVEKIKSIYPDDEKIFELPKGISKDRISTWINDYPKELCPEEIELSDSLFITPFDIRARSLLSILIQEAEKFIFITAESFTDEDFADTLIYKKINSEIDICLLCGSKSMDFTDRIHMMFKRMLSVGIMVNTTEEKLHGKLLITDKRLAISSINLNKINLGYTKNKKKYWRGNTETITICSTQKTIKIAQEKFNSLPNVIHIEEKLKEKIYDTLLDNMFSNYDLSKSAEVKSVFSKLILTSELNIHTLVQQIGKEINIIMKSKNKKFVRIDDFCQSYILYSLSERKHGFRELEDEIRVFYEITNLQDLLNDLVLKNQISETEGIYKLKPGRPESAVDE